MNAMYWKRKGKCMADISIMQDLLFDSDYERGMGDNGLVFCTC